jgi:hypothetical protein
MYGLVNEGIRELVISLAGPKMWESMCEEAGVEPEGFEPLCPYHDSLTYKLVELASDKLAIPIDTLLRKYGRFWVTYTAEQGYGEIMNLFGTDFRTCLTNLNRTHAHMGAMMPALQPPRFNVEVSNDSEMIVHYFSHRPGLAPMVEGLLDGLAEKFGDTISIRHIPKGERSDHDEFEVELHVA